ncbi:uncharacterized protein LOC134610491 [Pelobates fuscus]|uniref:uncharacterized protein LOC134610491 n=1 Tax=Pelobates fuscus TaxID=191477 RepID=UPI002FE4B2F2
MTSNSEAHTRGRTWKMPMNRAPEISLHASAILGPRCQPLTAMETMKSLVTSETPDNLRQKLSSANLPVTTPGAQPDASQNQSRHNKSWRRSSSDLKHPWTCSNESHSPPCLAPCGVRHRPLDPRHHSLNPNISDIEEIKGSENSIFQFQSCLFLATTEATSISDSPTSMLSTSKMEEGSMSTSVNEEVSATTEATSISDSPTSMLSTSKMEEGSMSTSVNEEVSVSTIEISQTHQNEIKNETLSVITSPSTHTSSPGVTRAASTLKYSTESQSTIYKQPADTVIPPADPWLWKYCAIGGSSFLMVTFVIIILLRWTSRKRKRQREMPAPLWISCDSLNNTNDCPKTKSSEQVLPLLEQVEMDKQHVYAEIDPIPPPVEKTTSSSKPPTAKRFSIPLPKIVDVTYSTVQVHDSLPTVYETKLPVKPTKLPNKPTKCPDKPTKPANKPTNLPNKTTRQPCENFYYTVEYTDLTKKE